MIKFRVQINDHVALSISLVSFIESRLCKFLQPHDIIKLIVEDTSRVNYEEGVVFTEEIQLKSPSKEG